MIGIPSSFSICSPHLNKPCGFAVIFLSDILAGNVYIAVDTIKQRNAHCDSTNIKTIVLYHSYRFQHVICINHFTEISSLDMVHTVKISSCIVWIFTPHCLTKLCQSVCHGSKIGVELCDVNKHYHSKEVLQN